MKRLVSVCLLLSSLGAMNARAQSLSISGTVTDDAGAVPQAAVTLKVSGQIVIHETAADGKYSFDSLKSGVYNISIVKAGYEAIENLVTLNNESQVFDAKLAVGAVSTRIVVTDVAGKATASRLPILNEEIPAQVSTISKETLQTQSVNDLATALRNVSGASAQRFYGVYEYYTFRGFNQADIQAVDGMRMEGNRINTQLNNVEQVEVLKGPASVLYGGGALSGVINIIRKKPQGTRAYDLFYRGGRWNLQNFGGGATGPIIENKLLFRVDASYEHNNGWRGAGARRFNVSPSLTWLINSRNRVTVHESINRDDFDGDGGLPLDVINIPGFDLSRRYSTPYDFEHFRDSQTHVLFNSTLSSNWEFRDGFFKRWTNDRYFITEGVPYLPATNEIERYALFFEHHRRPVMNQADVVGRFSLLGMRHTLLFGHEYQDFYNITDRTADGGDIFPGNINATNPVETFTGPDLTVLEQDHASNRIQAGFWQDQINVTEHLSLNIAGRYDDYRRSLHIDLRDTASQPYVRGTDTVLNQTAYTFRAGAVYSLPHTQQIYFNSANSFQPVTQIPADGSQLKPETGITYEFGHRWQALNGRFKTNIAFYKLERNNVTINLGQRRYTQAGQQSSKGIDLDITGSLGKGIDVVANYGYTLPRFDNYIEGGENLSGMTPRYTQRHAANVWLSKSWTSGLRISAGTRYLGPQFTNNSNTIRLGGYTTFSGAVGYRIKNWDLSVNAENLLNRQRYFQGSDYDNQVYPGSPINVFTTIRYRFQ